MVRLPLGEGSIDVSLPDCEVTVAKPPGGEPVDPRAAAERAVAEPHGPRLRDIADASDEVALVVTDVTRATPDDELADVLLSELDAAGVDREQVTIILGLGLHRPMTDAEIEAGLGRNADLAINHDPEATVRVGEVDACPVEVHEAVADADLVCSTGMVEPHQYAGFSGGAKTVVIGAGSEAIIRYTHGPEMLSRDGVRLGRVDGNPFRDALDRAGDLAGPDFCLNVTHGPAGILDAAAGDPRSVVRALAESAREALSVAVDGEYDAVVAGVGAPKDANLYQATRALTYVVLGPRNPLRDGGSEALRASDSASGEREDDRREASKRGAGGARERSDPRVGRVVVPAVLPEGAGEGTGERRFYRRLSEASDAESLYREMREGYEPGAQRAFVVAKALRRHDCYVTNSAAPEIVEDCLMSARDTVTDAIPADSEVLIVPASLNTLLT